MKTVYMILIIFIFTMNAESKNMKMIFFYDYFPQESEGEGKIITNNSVIKIRKISHLDLKRNEKYSWKYYRPIFLGINYITIKNYFSEEPKYDDYSIQILDDKFNFKEELFKIRNHYIGNIAYNPLKKIIAFSVAEQEGEGKDSVFHVKSFLYLYDLSKKKVILSKEMGQYHDELDFTTRAFNSTGEYICLEKSNVKIMTQNGWEQISNKNPKVVLYDIANDKEYFIHEGRRPSFVADNQIVYIYDGSLYLYDLKTEKTNKYFSSKLFENIGVYFISPDNKQIIIGYVNNLRAEIIFKNVLYNFDTKNEIKWDLLKEVYVGSMHIDWQFDE